MYSDWFEKQKYEIARELVASVCLLKHTFMSQGMMGADPDTTLQNMYNNFVRIKRALGSYATLALYCRKDKESYHQVMLTFAALDRTYRPFLSEWHGKKTSGETLEDNGFTEEQATFVLRHKRVIDDIAEACLAYASA